ncbi:hypothetical protein BS78_09G232700 [Paspalum vaginatum]|nr:hypothetical protein BS78_09G232700 [Paspalum vaginatum]
MADRFLFCRRGARSGSRVMLLDLYSLKADQYVCQQQRTCYWLLQRHLSPNICHLRIFSISFFYDMSFYMKIGYLRCTMIPVEHPWLNG